ncbi:receptor-like protein 7 [Macadamia integrifolia]|uniref:receptor-like protein 7 n=1 Tax=Macadamia integrifolia TaxID=60698 RepID=UPI001C4E4865|nr:receptor-like protein 7 [Macadamia integrifolia]
MLWWCFLIFLLSLFQAFCFSSPSPSPFPSPSPQLCHHDDRSTLLQLKQKHYHVLSNHPLNSWKPNTDCCYWEGITCNGTTGHVISLDLSDLSLFGSLRSNSSLFHLHHLQMLNLSYNYFSGQIPSQISQFTNLVSLNLSFNYFEGQIPPEISQLTKLAFLDLSYNGYSQLEIMDLGTFVQNLSSLIELHLDEVNLSAPKNRGWCHDLSSSLPNLQVLTMYYCSLMGPLDLSISNLRFLSVLFLDDNDNISSTVPSSLMNLTSLTVLRLASCGLHGDFPINVFLLPNLKYIDLYENFLLSGHLPEFPQENNALQHLEVGLTKFQGKLPGSVRNLKVLNSLGLLGLNLSGPIPPFLPNLTHLNMLDLSSNSLSGPIPTFFRGSFPNLETLYLDDNLLQGPIHSYLFFLSRKVGLSYNQFNGVINEPIQNISVFSPRPRLFTVAGNNLRGQDLMRSISNFTGLFWFLDLSFNDFSYMVEDTNLSNDSLSTKSSGEIFVNAQIQSFRFGSCNVSKFPDFLRNQMELYELDLSYNRINKLPVFLGDLKELSYLDISSNKFDGVIPNWIWQKNFMGLNLSNNFFTGLELPLPNQSDIGSLEYLDLHSNKIQECLSIVPYFPQPFNESNREFVSHILGNLTFLLSQLSYLSISNNKLTGRIPFSFCNGSHLNILDLSNNQLSGTIPTCFGSTNLGVLNLEGNKLHGPIPPFKHGCNLHTLKLNKNMLQGKIPRSLGNCRDIKVLDIGNNQLNDTFPYWLENLSKLEVLVIRSNKFGGPIAQLPQANSSFPSLHVIDLSFNNFTGNLPVEYICHWKAMMVDENYSALGNRYLRPPNSYEVYYQDTLATMDKGLYLKMPRVLTTFVSVDLSNNSFEGKIPDALGNLKALKVLNLSGNSLSGQIPFSLGNLSELESLDLSRNKLSGEIPRQLASLTSLEVLDLSYNNLTGSIPHGNQFNTFSNDSYKGNVGLCGFPLSIECRVRERALPPTSTFQQEEDDATSSFDWIFALAGYCSGLIVGLVIGQQLFWRKNRCSKFISRLVVSKQRKWSRKIKQHKRRR